MSKFRSTSLLQQGERVTEKALVTEMNILASERRINQVNRRNFLATTGLAAGAIGALALSGCSQGNNTGVLTPPTAATNTPSVSDILNFALNLEYLESTFYLTLTSGKGLPASAMGTSPGAVTGGLAKVTFTDTGVQDLANQLAADELAHVQFLRATMESLSLTPVDMPALNLAALGPITTDAQFLAIARQLETTGVSAYEGAIGGLVSNIAALNYAATIHDTEGQHEGALRQYCIANGVTSSAVDSADIPPTATTIFNTSGTTGLNNSRTSAQVLMIVYANTSSGITSGGFYPNGLNGNIKST